MSSPNESTPLPGAAPATPESVPAAEPAVSAAPAASAETSTPKPAPSASRFAAITPWVVVAVLALLVAGWQAYDIRTRLSVTQKELARRLNASEAMALQNSGVVQANQEQLNRMHAKVDELENRLAESQGQQAALEKLYQDLVRGREEWVLAEIEQGITLAAQQLQLAGNVQGAVLVLQAADARLAASNRPQFISLRKVLLRDLDRLQAQPLVDYPGLNVRLDTVIVAIDSLPLVVDGRPREDLLPERSEPFTMAALASGDYWRQLGREIWSELRGLIRIQRFDRSEPVLMTPAQSFFLRENLKLRLLNARLALLMRDQWTFRNELAQAQLWLERHFDSETAAVRTAQASLAQLQISDIAPELPTLNASLSAIRSLRAGKEAR